MRSRPRAALVGIQDDSGRVQCGEVPRLDAVEGDGSFSWGAADHLPRGVSGIGRRVGWAAGAALDERVSLWPTRSGCAALGPRVPSVCAAAQIGGVVA